MRRWSLTDQSGQLAREWSQAGEMRASTDRRLTCDRCNELCCAHSQHRTVVIRELLTAQTCNRLLSGFKAKEGAMDVRRPNLHTEQLHDEGAAHRQDLIDPLAAELVGNE